jgi:hypothetical protein
MLSVRSPQDCVADRFKRTYLEISWKSGGILHHAPPSKLEPVWYPRWPLALDSKHKKGPHLRAFRPIAGAGFEPATFGL